MIPMILCGFVVCVCVREREREREVHDRGRLEGEKNVAMFYKASASCSVLVGVFILIVMVKSLRGQLNYLHFMLGRYHMMFLKGK